MTDGKQITIVPPPSQEVDLDELTPQEEKILLLAADDLYNKEIADQLNIAEATVKKHRENCYKKLNIKGRKQVNRLLKKLRRLK